MINTQEPSRRQTMLSNHNFDTTRSQKHQKPNHQQNKQQDDGELKNDKSPTLSFAQLE